MAVITGASSGIGQATARQLVARGAAVALVARREDRLNALVEELTAAGGRAIAITTDVTDAEAVARAARHVKDQLGPASILINNAGVMLPTIPFGRERIEDSNRQIDLNTTAVVSVIAAFTDQLVESAARGGVADVINTSSIAAQNLFMPFAVYAGTKAFVTHFSRTLREEFGPKGIRVSAIEPGLTETELYNHVQHDDVNAWLSGTKENFKWLQEENIADVVTFTVSLPAHVTLQQTVIMPTGQTG
ncbi:SDR family oxidoreductase [Streptomyces sp. NBC_00178]|uniref:SDR family oxidoreductase n=1 Tax=Streptomyces sp. NBC_00178 TaxID=2975672 RepID=UPI002E2CD83F|nr:SDR family oxidoreductase [Streptomyces sp. NBC_00178]